MFIHIVYRAQWWNIERKNKVAAEVVGKIKDEDVILTTPTNE